MSAKLTKLEVEDKLISLTSYDENDYICLTDMVRGEEGSDHIRNWMRNRNTVEFLGIWEQLNNPDFNGVEFDRFKKEAGLNSFNLTPKKWVESTNAKGIISKSGRYGGTYAHKDIAFEFGAWISPMFKLLLIKEFQRLKEIETNKYNLEWDVKRVLSKVNYQIHTDAVKNHIIPKSKKSLDKQWIEYAEEADLLNVALFGCTAKQWKESNPQLALDSKNMRDFASINELAVLSNLESLNSELIKSGVEKKIRFNNLQRIAKQQLEILYNTDMGKSIKKQSNSTYIDEQKKLE
ncbi:MAG: KilA-N domain-containing protein [Mesonia sp.]|uniref:KilA-N domain-containing protein n=1 Tax=Mesonia sp. TaxID=1960830 RepID=UPI003241D365